MYIQSEPYWINRVFPVFDQPDLKGHMTFHFIAPKEQQIICNTEVHTEISSETFGTLKE